jgi:uncharacterized protein (TIRG00374 family)
VYLAGVAGPRISTGARIAAGATVSAILLTLLLLHVDLGEVLEAFAQASVPWVGAILLVHLASLLARVVRWRLLLRSSGCTPAAPVSAWLVFDSVFFGWLCNLVLPARVGELARPGMYSRGAGVPFGRVLATSVVERAADIVVVVVGLWLALAVLPVPDGLPPELRAAARLAGLAAAAGVVVLALLARRSATAEPTSAVGGRLTTMASRFREGLVSLRDPGTVGLVLLWTVLIWALEAVCVWLAFVAFAHDPAWSAAICHVVAVTLSIAVVTVPAGLGVEQAVTVAVFAPWGISAADALAMSFVLTFAAVAWVVPAGLLALWRQGGGLPSAEEG